MRLREILLLDTSQQLALALAIIAILVLALIAAMGLSAALWHWLAMTRQAFHDLRANYREKMNLRAVETFARVDERKKTVHRRMHPDSLLEPLPPPNVTPRPRADTPIPDTLRSDELLADVRPPPLPGAPSERTADVRSEDLLPLPPPSSGLDWRDSRLLTTELPPVFPLVRESTTQVWKGRKTPRQE